MNKISNPLRSAALTIGISMTAMATAVVGCLDMPIIHLATPTSDAGDGESPPSDAKNEGPGADGADSCEKCMRADSQPAYGCGNEMAACATDAVCFGTIECSIAKGCFHLDSQSAIVDCGTPCAREAGLDIASPGAALIFAVVMCAQDHCGPICRGEVDASVR